MCLASKCDPAATVNHQQYAECGILHLTAIQTYFMDFPLLIKLPYLLN